MPAHILKAYLELYLGQTASLNEEAAQRFLGSLLVAEQHSHLKAGESSAAEKKIADPLAIFPCEQHLENLVLGEPTPALGNLPKLQTMLSLPDQGADEGLPGDDSRIIKVFPRSHGPSGHGLGRVSAVLSLSVLIGVRLPGRAGIGLRPCLRAEVDSADLRYSRTLLQVLMQALIRLAGANKQIRIAFPVFHAAPGEEVRVRSQCSSAERFFQTIKLQGIQEVPASVHFMAEKDTTILQELLEAAHESEI